jgi:hypothetical protein
MTTRNFTVAIVITWLSALPGCGPSQPDVTSMIAAVNNVNGKRLANLYAIYQSRHDGAGPKDRKAFETFIQEAMQPAELVGTGVDQRHLEPLFTSERDKQPFFIRYGVRSPDPSSPGINLAVCFEAEGVDGVVEVFLTGPKVERVPVTSVPEWKAGKHDRLQDGP